MKNNKKLYNDIITTLMENDKNGTYDEILKDCDNDFNYAISVLKSCLVRIVEDELVIGEDDEEINFYTDQLKKINYII